jgi:tetratricopeptide (TPR) repeat protein
MADHFEQGGDWLRAIKYLQLAADTAGRRFEPQQAAEVLEHALDLVKRLPEAERTASEIEILEKLAPIYVALGDLLQAIECYEALVARAAHDGLTMWRCARSSTWRGPYRSPVLSVHWKSWNEHLGSAPARKIRTCGQ